MPNNFSKVGPTHEVKIDPLPLVSAVFHWAAGKQDLTRSLSAPPPPRRAALWSCGKLMNGTYAKNKVNFPPKAQEDYQPQNSSPFSPRCSLLLRTFLPVPRARKLVTLEKKRRRRNHEVVPLSRFYCSAFSRCLQLSLFYSCTWLLRLWSSPLLHILWCILAYIVCNLTPCHLIPPTSHNPYQPLSPPFIFLLYKCIQSRNKETTVQL